MHRALVEQDELKLNVLWLVGRSDVKLAELFLSISFLIGSRQISQENLCNKFIVPTHFVRWHGSMPSALNYLASLEDVL